MYIFFRIVNWPGVLTPCQMFCRTLTVCSGQMVGMWLHCSLLLLLLLVDLVHSCPDACSKCSGPDGVHCEECRPGWTLHNYTCVGNACKCVGIVLNGMKAAVCVIRHSICFRHWRVQHRAGELFGEQLLLKHTRILWVQRSVLQWWDKISHVLAKFAEMWSQ